MTEFKKEVAGPDLKFQKITPFKDPDINAKAAQMEGIMRLTGMGATALDAQMVKMEQEDVLGTDLSAPSVQGKADAFNQSLQAVDLSKLDEMQRAQLSTTLLDEAGADAKTVDRLITSGSIGALEGEAYLRKRLGAIQSNPVLAALGSKVGDALGARAGAGRGLGSMSAASTALQRVQAKAEGQKEGIEKAEAKFAELESMGIPRAVTMQSVKETKAVEMEKVRLEQEQLTGKVDHRAGVALKRKEDSVALETLLSQSLNPETKMLDVNAAASVNAQQAQWFRNRNLEIESSTMSEADKKAAHDSLKRMYEINQSYISTLSKTAYDKAFVEANKSGNQADLYHKAPTMAYAKDNGLEEVSKQLAYKDVTRQKELMATYGIDMDMDEVVYGAVDLHTNALSPQPMGKGALVALGDQGAEVVVEKNEGNTNWNVKTEQAAVDNPVVTLVSLNNSEIQRQAVAGNEKQRSLMVRSFDSIMQGIGGDLARQGGTVGVRRSTRKRGGRSVAGPGYVIDFPEGMAGKEKVLREMFTMVQKNEWAWPEGSENYVDAFTKIVNGEAKFEDSGLEGVATGGSTGGQMARGKGEPEPERTGPTAVEKTKEDIAQKKEGDSLVELEDAKVGDTVFIGSRPVTIKDERMLTNFKAMTAEPEPAKPMGRGVSAKRMKANRVTLEPALQSVFDGLGRKEGEGDNVTSVATGKLGVTDSARKAVGAPSGTSDEKVAKSYIKYLDSKWDMVEGYEDAPDNVRGMLIDASYNLGESVTKYPKLAAALEKGDYEEVAKQLLDTAVADKKTLRGLAKRRAEAYNEVADTPIVEVEQLEDGTIKYLDGEGNEVFSFRSKGGRHPKSRVGVIGV